MLCSPEIRNRNFARVVDLMEERKKIKLFYKFVTRQSSRSEFEEFLNDFKTKNYQDNYEYLFDAYGESIKNEQGIKDSKNLAKEAKQVLERAKKVEAKRSVGRSIQLKNIWIKVAAAAVIALSVGLYWNYTNNIIKRKMELISAEAPKLIEKRTQYGQISNVTMSDGSNVKLNAGSKITFNEVFAGNIREVALEGEAFFDVARNEEKPFIISAGDVKVKVLGTSFDVKAFNEENLTMITVVSGRVSVAVDDEELILLPNEQACFSKSSGKLQFKKVDATTFTKWMNGTLYFEQTPIRDVVVHLERWYDVDITVNNTQILDKKITGEYTNASLKTVLRALEFSIGIKYKIEGQLITIY